eukprot:scaffold4229_cov30-Tisochrysis_lutea.AAC.11
MPQGSMALPGDCRRGLRAVDELGKCCGQAILAKRRKHLGEALCSTGSLYRGSILRETLAQPRQKLGEVVLA